MENGFRNLLEGVQRNSNNNYCVQEREQQGANLENEAHLNAKPKLFGS